MSTDHDEPPPTNFVALTPRSSDAHRLATPQRAEPPTAPTPPVAKPHSHPPPTPGSRPPQVGSGGFSGYEVGSETTQLRTAHTSNARWVVLGLLLGLGLLGAGAVALTFVGQ